MNEDRLAAEAVNAREAYWNARWEYFGMGEAFQSSIEGNHEYQEAKEAFESAVRAESAAKEEETVSRQAYERLQVNQRFFEGQEKRLEEDAKKSYLEISMQILGDDEQKELESYLSSVENLEQKTLEEYRKTLREKTKELARLYDEDLPNVQALIGDYEGKYRDNERIQKVLKDPADGKDLVEKIREARQEIDKKEDVFKKDFGYFSASVDELKTHSYGSFLKDVREQVTETEWQSLLDAEKAYKEAGDITESVIEQAVREKRAQRDRYGKLLDRAEYDKMEPTEREGLTAILNQELKKAGMGEIKSLAEFYEEEERLKGQKAALEEEQNNEAIQIFESRSLGHDAFFENRKKLNEEKKKAVDRDIDKLLNAYAGSVPKQLNSVQEYFDLEIKVDELSGKLKQKTDLLTDLGKRREMEEILSLGDGNDEPVRRVKAALEAYEQAKFEAEKLPETFTALEEMKKAEPARYDMTVRLIHEQLLNASKPAQHTFGNRTETVTSLEKYFELARSAETRQKKDAHKAIKAEIKKRFADYNNNKENEENRTAASERLEIATKEFEDAIKAYNDKLKKERGDIGAELEAAKQKSAELKKFLKEDVVKAAKDRAEKREKKLAQAWKEHEKRKKEIEDAVKTGGDFLLSRHAEQEAKEYKALNKNDKKAAYETQKKNIEEKLAAINREIGNKYRNVRKDYDDYRNERQADIEAFTRQLGKNIEDEKKGHAKRLEHAEDQLHQLRESQREGAVWDRRGSTVKKFAFGQADRCVAKLHRFLRNVVIGAEVAAVLGKLEEKEMKRQEHKRLLDMADLSMGSTGVVKKDEWSQLFKKVEELQGSLEPDSELSREIARLKEEHAERRKNAERELAPKEGEDLEQEKKVNGEVGEALRAAAGDNPDMQERVDFNEEVFKSDLQEALKEDEKLKKEFEENKKSVESVEETLKGVFNDNNGWKVKAALLAAEGATNLVIGMANAAGGLKLAKVDFNKTVQEYIGDGDQSKVQNMTFQEACVVAARKALQSFEENVKEVLDEKSREATGDYLVKRGYAEALEQRKEEYELFKKAYKVEHGNNKYDINMEFAAKQEGEILDTAHNRVVLCGKAVVQQQIVLDEKQAASAEASRTKSEKENVLNDKKETLEGQQREAYQVMKRKMKETFGAAVRAGAATDAINRPAECAFEDLQCNEANGTVGKNGIAFLSKMTGLGENPSIAQIFHAASRVYISGINASAVCGLEESYRQMQECGENGADQSGLKDAFMEKVENLDKELRQSVVDRINGSMPKSAYGLAIISIENEHMGLSAVTVAGESADINRDKVEKANRQMKSGNADLNQFRVEAAEKQMKEKKDRTKAEKSMVTALHRSRELSFRDPKGKAKA